MTHTFIVIVGWQPNNPNRTVWLIRDTASKICHKKNPTFLMFTNWLPRFSQKPFFGQFYMKLYSSLITWTKHLSLICFHLETRQIKYCWTVKLFGFHTEFVTSQWPSWTQALRSVSVSPVCHVCVTECDVSVFSVLVPSNRPLSPEETQCLH